MLQQTKCLSSLALIMFTFWKLNSEIFHRAQVIIELKKTKNLLYILMVLKRPLFLQKSQSVRCVYIYNCFSQCWLCDSSKTTQTPLRQLPKIILGAWPLWRICLQIFFLRGLNKGVGVSFWWKFFYWETSSSF